MIGFFYFQSDLKDKVTLWITKAFTNKVKANGFFNFDVYFS